MKTDVGTIGENGPNDCDDHDKPATCSQRILKMLLKRLPILTWLPHYSRSDAIGDLIAGVTVGLTVVPQSMAYAAIAGLSPEYGLYSSYIAVIIYVLLGSCRQATLGPTAVMSLLTFQTCGQDYPACVILTSFYVGCFELIMAGLHLGWVVSFISDPVTVGFTSGAAMTILSSQVNSLLGLSGEKGNGFITYWQAIFKNIGTIRAGDAILGFTSLIALMLLRKLKDVKSDHKPLRTAYWLISLSRNVIVILVTSMIAYFWHQPPFKLVGKVQGGFPQVGPPEFELSYRPHHSNETDLDSSQCYSFMETWSLLKTGPLVIALVSVLQNVAISKSFGAGQPVDATQEMLALGTANLVGGFFSAVPISASFSRSAVNEASGVRSQLGGLYTGILVLLSLNFLTSSFYWIPKSSLAAVIIGAVIFMIDYESVVPMWQISKMDAVACLITFIASVVLGMEYGILIGCVISIGAILLRTLRPEIKSHLLTDQSSGLNYILIEPSSSGLIFPSVDHISTSVQKLTLKHKECSLVVIDFERWTESDFTASNTLICIEKGLRKNGKQVGFLHCHPSWVNVLKIGGLRNPPLISDLEDIPRFIRDQVLGSAEKELQNLKSIVVTPTVIEPSLEGEGQEVNISSEGADSSEEGMREGVGAISVASTGSGTDVMSIASSTKPII